MKNHEDLHHKGPSVMCVEKSFYEKPKYKSLKDGTVQSLKFGGVVWFCFGVFFGGGGRGRKDLGVLLYFLPFQYINRKVPDKFKDVEYNHQDSEVGWNLSLILDFLKNLLVKFNL